jgi:hypothetical protein
MNAGDIHPKSENARRSPFHSFLDVRAGQPRYGGIDEDEDTELSKPLMSTLTNRKSQEK